MKELLPQEVVVWYAIPAIRREISVMLLKQGMAQKDIAESLGVTQAAVSQYIKSKRGSEIKFPTEFTKKISIAAKQVQKDPKSARKQIYSLSEELIGSKILCNVHMDKDKSVKKGCTICFK